MPLDNSRRPKSKAYCRGQEIWSLLSASDRTAVRVLAELRAEGFKTSKATVSRWAQEWRQVVHTAADILEATSTKEVETRDLSLRAALPADLKEVLPGRLLSVSRGTGTDAVEHAICAVSDAIRSQARHIVSDPDHTRLRTFTSALEVMASALERVANVRLAVSVAHRSYSEGDRLLAEAERFRAEAKKLDAEAEVTLQEVKVLNAKAIPSVPPEGDYDPLAEAFRAQFDRK